MKIRVRFCFLLVGFLISHLVSIAQDIEILADNVQISIAKRNKGESIYQSWRIINHNKSSIFLPAPNKAAKTPFYEAARLGPDLVVRIGRSTLMRGIPLEIPMQLVELIPGDSLKFDIEFNDYRLPADISGSNYDSLIKDFAVDYIVESDLETIYKTALHKFSVSGSDYSKWMKIIIIRQSLLASQKKE